MNCIVFHLCMDGLKDKAPMFSQWQDQPPRCHEYGKVRWGSLKLTVQLARLASQRTSPGSRSQGKASDSVQPAQRVAFRPTGCVQISSVPPLGSLASRAINCGIVATNRDSPSSRGPAKYLSIDVAESSIRVDDTAAWTGKRIQGVFFDTIRYLLIFSLQTCTYENDHQTTEMNLTRIYGN